MSFTRLRVISSRRPSDFGTFTASPAELPENVVPATATEIATGFLRAVWHTDFRPTVTRQPTTFLPSTLYRNRINKRQLTEWERPLLTFNERLCSPAVLGSLTGSMAFAVSAKHMAGRQNFGWAVSRGGTLIWAGHGTVPEGLERPDLTTAFLAGTYAAVYLCLSVSTAGPFTAFCRSPIGHRALQKIGNPTSLRRHTLSHHFDWLIAIRDRLRSINLRCIRPPSDPDEAVADILRCASAQLSTQLLSQDGPEQLTPAPATTVTVLIDNKVLNSNYRYHLRQAYHLPKLREYLQEKFGWTQQDFSDVHWAAIHAAYRRRTVNQQLRTTKFMYGWLPIGRTRKRIDPRSTDKCPSCFGRFESSLHLLRCPDNARRVLRTCQLDTLRAFLEEWRTPPPVSRVLLTGLHRLQRDPNPWIDPAMAGDDSLLRRAIVVQNSLGWDKIVLGFIASDFHYAAIVPLPPQPRQSRQCRHRRHAPAPQPAIPALFQPQDHPPVQGASGLSDDPLAPPLEPTKKRDKHPLFWGAKLVTAMWNFFEEHWATRNEALHGHTESETASSKLSRLHQEVDDIYATKDSLLFADRILLDKPIEDIKSMSVQTLEVWLHHVRLALDRCLLDAAETPDSQQLVTDFFSPLSPGIT